MTPHAVLPPTAAQMTAAAMTPAQQTAARTRISETAHKFEASFLSTMLQSVFKDVDLGGGEGGEAFKSIMMDAVGKQIANGRGVGLAKSVQAEMLKLQGLS
jgi:Rod binding domain-containing protein